MHFSRARLLRSGINAATPVNTHSSHLWFNILCSYISTSATGSHKRQDRIWWREKVWCKLGVRFASMNYAVEIENAFDFGCGGACHCQPGNGWSSQQLVYGAGVAGHFHRTATYTIAAAFQPNSQTIKSSRAEYKWTLKNCVRRLRRAQEQARGTPTQRIN